MTKKSLHEKIEKVLNDAAEESPIEHEGHDLSAQITKERLEPAATKNVVQPAETETMRKFSQMISKRRINQI